MRINKNVIIGVGGAAVVVLAVAPRAFGALLPLLVVAACPLSMVLMMRVMGGDRSRDRQQPPDPQPDDAASAGQIEHLRAEIARLREEVGSSEPERDADLGTGIAEAG